MDLAIPVGASERADATRELADFIVTAIDRAETGDAPFHHLKLDRIFPNTVYAQMLKAMPSASDYRPMHGRSKAVDGNHTRVKIDLFPEYIRHLPKEKLPVWRAVGDALCSEPVKNAFVRKLAPGLKRRFGDAFTGVGMYPIPILTRDIPGYSIPPHTDTHWKGITVQLYLPEDSANTDIGTIFHERRSDGSLQKTVQMQFAPNSGYAFAVGDDSWHSADPVHDRVKTRDSILLTYFVDQGALRFLRNRGKRVGNMLLNEVRNIR